MSRIPQSQRQSRTPIRPTASATPRSRGTTPVSATPRLRTKSTPSRPSNGTPSKRDATKDAPPPPMPALSIKEAIALKRAEAKKAQKTPVRGLDTMGSLEDAIPIQPKEEVVEEGRWSIRETIERAQSTGSVNLAARSLQCIPSALFEIHLGVKPDPLRFVPDEPPLPDSTSPRRTAGNEPAWFETQDLTVLKAWNNDIVEIQPEIFMFGSLKVVDLHNNKLESLPESFCDLTALTNLDISHNNLSSLPDNIFALPELTTFKVSYNKLTALPLNAPFANDRQSPTRNAGGSFFQPTITRSSSTLPRLINLEASHNKILADAIDLTLPPSLMRVDLSSNPLGSAKRLIAFLGSLPKLKEIRMAHAEIADEALPGDASTSTQFPSLSILDLEETKVSLEAVKGALSNLQKELSFESSDEDPPAGVLRVTVGKRVMKEAWEIELDRRQQAKPQIVQENWVDEPVLTEGAKRRLRAEAAMAAVPAKSSLPATSSTPQKPAIAKKVPMKEVWELEAEQGLLTEGAKRRARAAAALAEQEMQKQQQNSTPARATSPASGLSSPEYYTAATRTLKLPASAALPKSHSRGFSLASGSALAPSTKDIAVPTPTLPLAEISTQSFAPSLKTLVANNRKLDKSFSLPADASFSLPCLEELSVEGCDLPDPVEVSSGEPPRRTEPLFALITRICPNLRVLNLSYNAIPSSSLAKDVLDSLLLTLPLKQLSLRGNRLSELDGFQAIATMFKGNREVHDWTLDELDLRDNEISRLPPELGLLPLDVFLVDGNTFRVPSRRIWEREGTKGLLSWLRGRIE